MRDSKLARLLAECNLAQGLFALQAGMRNQFGAELGAMLERAIWSGVARRELSEIELPSFQAEFFRSQIPDVALLAQITLETCAQAMRQYRVGLAEAAVRQSQQPSESSPDGAGEIATPSLEACVEAKA